MTKPKYLPEDPNDLHPTTDAGIRMTRLATSVRNNFSDYETHGKVSPAAVLSGVFAKGSSAESHRTKMDKVGPRNLRAQSATVLTVCTALVVLAPPLAPVFIPALIVSGILEKMRHTIKKEIKTIAEKAPQAEKTLNDMIERLGTVTDDHFKEQSPQSQKALNETIKGFVSIFSRKVGFNESAFDGRKFGTQDPGTKDSPMVTKMNSELSRAIAVLENTSSTGPSARSAIQPDFGIDISRVQDPPTIINPLANQANDGLGRGM